jgi:PAS domain-containing protein
LGENEPEQRTAGDAGPAPHEGESHFRRLLETLPAGAHTCDPEGLITYFNPQAERLRGCAPKLNDPEDRFCGSFRLFAADGSPDGSPIAHDRCWMALALETHREYNERERSSSSAQTGGVSRRWPTPTRSTTGRATSSGR